MPELKVWRDIVCEPGWLLGGVVDATYEEIMDRPLPGSRDITEKIKRECCGPITEQGVMACIAPILEDLSGPFLGPDAKAVEMRKKFLDVFKRKAKEFIEETAKGVL